METGQLITIYLVSALVAGLIATMAARAKRRHSGYWMLACFLFPPFLLLLLVLPKGKTVHNPQGDPFGGETDEDEGKDSKTVPIEPVM